MFPSQSKRKKKFYKEMGQTLSEEKESELEPKNRKKKNNQVKKCEEVNDMMTKPISPKGLRGLFLG